ncbi:MAG: endonuclease domain-containing protein [bacterium]
MSEFLNKSDQKITRKKLRNQLTPYESKLWIYLKNRQLLGYKFRRQYGIGKYIVDFCCVEKKVVIELDGILHMNNNIAENDKKRDLILIKLGYKVLRYSNKEIMNSLENVLESIKNSLTSPSRYA